jgi:hypothetical protein
MKKTLIIPILLTFLGGTAFADSTNIGVKINAANFAATGSNTTNSSSGGSGGTAVSYDKDADVLFPSIFVERQFTQTSFDFALGIDYVPLTHEIDTLGGGTGFDATIEIGNLITAYVQPMYKVSGDVTVFGKLGYSQADLDVNEISRQSTSGSGGTASTDTAQKKSLEGPMIGLGVQIDRSFGEFSFIRIEATSTDFDEITHTNSNSKVLKADADMNVVSLSIGKSF